MSDGIGYTNSSTSDRDVNDASSVNSLPSTTSTTVGKTVTAIGGWEKHTKGFGSKMLEKFGFKGRLGTLKCLYV